MNDDPTLSESGGDFPQNPDDRTRPPEPDRRHFIAQCGALGAGLFAFSGRPLQAQSVDSSTPANNICVLTPEQTEGPYYLNLNRLRRDITEGRQGVPLSLSLRVVDAGSCAPIPGAVVDIWHCDAQGEYSGYDSSRPLRWGHMEPDSDEEIFLRGVQVADAEGQVTFTTIYPGCYTSRTTHIHAKVYLSETELATTQLYFPDELTERIYQDRRYRAERSTTNANDYIMRRARGKDLAMLSMSAAGTGYLGQLTIGVSRT